MRKRFSGKNLYRAPLLLGATLMLSACGLWQDSSEPPAQPETPPDMQVDVKLRALHRCSRISPEMVVTNVPKGTDYFDVRLLENEPQERLLGGGNWENDGTGIIPEGALTLVYTGPCPPAGSGNIMRNTAASGANLSIRQLPTISPVSLPRNIRTSA